MNARFWTSHHGDGEDSYGDVRLTLRPGQAIEIRSGGPAEEGYSYSREVFEFDGSYVWLHVSNDSRDCDGRMTSERTLRCPVGLLRSHRPEYHTWTESGTVVTHGNPRPYWEEVDGCQRDFTAEAAGY